ncbi:two-component sensor histidine kinase [Cellulomonas chitinilytica]|uniref:histidine kinase n=1 Tax=Cellulomonas chitinilytica TaxID=398759 RepID=A0A919P9F7_9CELL|nr:histidine kinase [Cellulomonas chitinilytica]GIG23689.1 two-component sensor histidine kinase [Cellulomonas chitinilytica]
MSAGHRRVLHRPAAARGPSVVGWRDICVATMAVAVDLALFTPMTQLERSSSWPVVDAPPWVVVLAAVPAWTALLLRRRAPIAVSLGLAGYAAALTVTIGSRPVLTLLVALYNAAAWRSPRRSLLCLAATLVANGVAVAYESAALSETVQTTVELSLLYVLFDGTAWGVGWWVGSARREAKRLRETREAMAAEAVAAERVRIAHELHDIVAHAVTVMVLQAAGARRTMDQEPELARGAMQTVEDVGKEAIGELRRLLAVLRTVGDDGDVAVIGTSPRLTTVPDLVTQAESAGVRVTLCERGTPGKLDPSVDLAAFRVIQEALTNVTRHAGAGTTVDVGLHWLPDSLRIDVHDDGAGVPPRSVGALSTGHGLAGLQERVTIVGGALDAGPVARGGYRVTATLPAHVP